MLRQKPARFASDHPIGPAGFLPRSLYRYAVVFSNVLDLIDPATLDHLDVAANRLVQEDRTLTHQIGELAHQFPYQGVLNGSATGVASALSVFNDNLRGRRVLPELEATWTDLDDIPIF